jgi:putative endonuclease
MKLFYVYIVASGENGTIYIGVTTDLVKRISQHKNKIYDGFTKKYNVDKLVHYESYGNPEDAFNRETQLKNWKRAWKLKLINQFNPKWEDLFEKII